SEPKEENEVSMCKSMEIYTRKAEMRGVIKYLKGRGEKEEDIVARLMDQFNQSEEYVRDQLNEVNKEEISQSQTI
ncbi:MAG: hypothetical protein IJ137_12280, partial [Eubacterium sp.]|nr:hypothetical protein [Eubacterium sp.]